MANFNEMGKMELRNACKEAAIKGYGKMTNAQMREALQAAEKIEITEAEFVAMYECLNYSKRENQLEDNYSNGSLEVFMDALGWGKNAVAALIGSLEKKGLVESENERGDGENCVWLTEKGVNLVFDELEKGRVPADKVEKPAEEAVKQKEERAVRNGVRLPKRGTSAGTVWSICDAILADTAIQPTVAAVREEAVAAGINKKNAEIEFYTWRKFNGIKGRASK